MNRRQCGRARLRACRRYSASSSGSVILMVGGLASASCSALDSRRICSAVICRQAGRRKQAWRCQAAAAASEGGRVAAAARAARWGGAGGDAAPHRRAAAPKALSSACQVQQGPGRGTPRAAPLACVGAACLFFTPVTRGSLCSRCDAVVPAMPAIFAHCRCGRR
jgi:hypothetical protein